MTKRHNKRRFKRIKSSLLASYRIKNDDGEIISAGDASVVNISKTGLLLISDNDIPPQTNLEIAIDIEGQPIQLKCRSMYCSDTESGRFESGIQIVKINKNTIEIYFSYLKKLDLKETGLLCLRNEISEMPGIVKRISAEHKIINKYVLVLGEMLGNDSIDELQIIALMHLMKKDITTHFNIEENLFFDIACDVLPDQCNDLVKNLRKDHKDFLKEIDKITTTLQNPGDGNTCIVSKEIKKEIEILLEKIKNHAVEEVRELFPLLESTDKAKKLILEKVVKITNQL